MNSKQPQFRVWIRRDGDTWSLKFEVTDGKGILRTARPGVLIDPPATVSDSVDGLTAAQVQESRFLHAWAGGLKRRGYLLSMLEDHLIADLAQGAWFELDAERDKSKHYLKLHVDDLQEISLSEVALATEEGAEEEEDDEVPEVAAPAPVRAPVPATAASPAPAPAPAPAAAPVAAPAPIAAAALPDEPDNHLVPALLGPATVLVRHLRRELTREKLRAMSMAERLAMLEERLRALGEEVPPPTA